MGFLALIYLFIYLFIFVASLGAREASDPRSSVTRGDMPYLQKEERERRSEFKERGTGETNPVERRG